MIGARVYKGIEFIRISELPLDQQPEIKKWANNEVVIKIQAEDTLYSDCIQYKDYVYWFESIFKVSITEQTKLAPTKGIKNIGFALGN